ncbi:MAG: cytidine deaminase [Oscillospiraceae bacterium]|nr:cytidine deaminase [Oscillospiraceae bacterium]
MTEQELIQTAQAMLDRAYAPYSRYPVGAALLCADGTVFTGCNVENASSPCGICAERTAVAKAVSEGHTDFVRLAVISRADGPCTPCGMCRQVLYEFAPELELLCCGGDGSVLKTGLRELLPHGFGPDSL